ncbi:MAG: peptide MFS transporter [Gammaproteobacteria bacterium]|nr:peptide MFS transporter [Gammaproteobacteria bacterium]MCH9744950.1 peptide MFS transporter [Gammaproteobacteria bacterium]
MKQPEALKPLFLTETWERLGFYIVQALLVLYMTLHLNFSDDKAYAIAGEYSALIYISPIIGGFFADKIIGFRYSILIGAIALFAGYCMITTSSIHIIFWGMAVIILGNGFLKPNISSFLGEFYNENDPRREGGFTIFYMGINIGSMLATLSSGFIQQHLGWSPAFGFAAIGMLLGILVYVWGFKYYESKGMPHKVTAPSIKFFANKIVFVSCLALIVIIAYLFLTNTGYGNEVLLGMGIIMLFGLLYAANRHDAITRNKMYALIILIAISIVFWALFFQIFFAVNLFTDRNVDRVIFGIHIPAASFLSFEPIFILILGAPLAKMWQRLHRAKRNPSLGTKFSLSMLFTAFAFFVLMLATKTLNSHHQVFALWLVLFYFSITMGEMFLSPIGLAMITELSPPRLTGLMMGVWFMSLGFGGALTGVLARFASVPKSNTNLVATAHIYGHAFGYYALFSLIAGLITLALTPWIKRLICYHSYKQ